MFQRSRLHEGHIITHENDTGGNVVKPLNTATLAVKRGKKPAGIVNREITAHRRWLERFADYRKRFSG